MRNIENINSTRKRPNVFRRSETIEKINDNKRHNDDKTNVSTKVLMHPCHHSNFALQQSPNPKIILVPHPSPTSKPTPIDHSNLANHNKVRRRRTSDKHQQKIEKSEYFASTLVLNRSVFLIATCLIVFPTLFYPGVHSSPSDNELTFTCPEEFGYYPHPDDCSKYFVCVFGGPLLESCTVGLMYSNELQTCDWPRNVLCNRASRKRQHIDVAKSRIDVQISSSEEPTGQKTTQKTSKSSSSSNNKQNNNNKKKPNQDEDLRHPRVIEQETAQSFDSFGKKHVSYSTDKILNDESLSDITTDRGRGSPKRKVDHIIQEQTNDSHNSKESESSKRKGDTDANVFQDKTERSFVTIDVRLDPGHGTENLIQVDSTTSHSKVSTSTSSREGVTEKEEEQDLSAIPSKLLYKNDDNIQDYKAHEGEDIDVVDEGAFDIYDYDFEDYIAKLEADEQLYYTFWNDPIYDEFVDEKTGKKVKGLSQQSGENVTLDYSKYPERPKKLYPNVNNVVYGKRATECNERRCRLPDCMCGKSTLEDFTKGAKDKKKKLPQLVILTFDDSVNDLNRILYEELFDRKNRVNPNGCPILATFYISHEWTDYAQVQNLYADGHEVASHSISHSYGESFSKTEWMREMVGQRELLSAFSGVDLSDIRGLRAPFLAIGGDSMFDMMYEANFTYDSSMPIYENSPPPFPYTLDYKPPHECMIPPCPEKAYPGLWEIPLVMWNDLGNGRCSMADACSNPSSEDDVYKLLMANFQRHYVTNRAPFGLFYHAAWFTQPHHRRGFETFLDTLVGMDDVWFVTSWQAIQFMRQLPKFAQATEDEIRNFPAFRCHDKKQKEYCKYPKVCNLWHKSGVRYMRTCQACPKHYPWTGKTGIFNSLADQPIKDN